MLVHLSRTSHIDVKVLCETDANVVYYIRLTINLHSNCIGKKNWCYLMTERSETSVHATDATRELIIADKNKNKFICPCRRRPSRDAHRLSTEMTNHIQDT